MGGFSCQRVKLIILSFSQGRAMSNTEKMQTSAGTSTSKGRGRPTKWVYLISY